MSATYTNSSLSCARACLREYDLRYIHQLSPEGIPAEALEVGSLWHLAHELKTKTRDGGEVYRAIRERAPSELWAEKLARLYTAHGWYWQGEPFEVVESELTFSIALGEAVGDLCPEPLRDRIVRGQIDGVVRSEGGQLGLIEYKTTSDSDLDDYFRKLPLDTQVSMYAIAARSLPVFDGRYPDFIVYDVTRKPSIKQKALTKADLATIATHSAYFGEALSSKEALSAQTEKRESPKLYGARLTADIGNEPARYFARRQVHRTTGDYERAIRDLVAQIESLEASTFYRNPDACFRWHRPCDFYRLCSVGAYPARGEVPEGFVVREHRHPELDGREYAS